MSGKTYVDPLLTNIAKGYRPSGHINELVLPVLSVKKDTAKIASYGASNLRIVTSIKAPEGETPTVQQNVTQADAYTIEEHALKAMASDYEADNQDSPFDVQRDRTEYVTDLLSVSREYGLASFMNVVGNFTNNTTLSTYQWGKASDDPLGNLATAIAAVADYCGKPDEAISLIMSAYVWRKFRTLDEVKDMLGFKYAGTAVPTAQQVAAALGVRQILIGSGMYNSAKDGQTDTLAQMWGKHAWAMHIPANPQLKEQAFGWTPRTKGAVVDKWYDSDRKGFWVRNTDAYDQYIMDEKCAYMIENAVA